MQTLQYLPLTLLQANICDSHGFTNQKLDYIHDNPCKGKWNLSENPVGYLHSSAIFYIDGVQGI